MIRAKTPGQPGRRRILRGVAVTLLCVLALGGMAHGAAWLWLTGAMTVAFSDWVTQQRAMGWEVDHDLPIRRGWPFAARISIPDIHIAGWTPTLPQGFVWEAAQLDLTIAPPRIDRVVITADGQQRIASGAVSIPYTTARLRAVLPLDHGPSSRPAKLVLEGLHAETPDGPLTASRIEARLAPGGGDGEPGLGLRIEAQQLSLPPMPELAAFGRDVQRAALDAVLTGPPPPPLPMTPRERAEAWRAGGGALDLQAATVRWGPLVGEMSMVLRLDAALQPVGNGRLALERPAEVIASLAAAGAVDPRAAMTAQAVLGMVARAPAGGGAPRVEVPVGIADGVISLARIPLLRLRPVIWPADSSRHP